MDGWMDGWMDSYSLLFILSPPFRLAREETMDVTSTVVATTSSSVASTVIVAAPRLVMPIFSADID
jgi:hypothetical protein